MSEPTTITTGTKIKAFVCRVCFMCVIARKWPDSGFAQWLRKVEKDCPCCRAFRQLQDARK